MVRIERAARRRLLLSGCSLWLAALVFGAADPSAALKGDCIQPVSTGSEPSVADCLHILRAAVGAASCNPSCACDPSGNGAVQTSDALLCLRSVVGQSVVLDCPCDPLSDHAGPSCEDNCERSLQLCGSELFEENYSSIADCTEECVEIVEDFADEAPDYNLCYDRQVVYIECCTGSNQCGQIPSGCTPEFINAAQSCDGSFGGCPLIFF